MAKITITEALAEVPTIAKRIEKKQAFVMNYLYRQASVRDPHEADGGSAKLIAQEVQGIYDLCNRLIAIRAAIQKANAENFIAIGKQTRTIQDWLTWRREVAAGRQHFLGELSKTLRTVRAAAQKQGRQVVEKDPGSFNEDVIANVNEKDLAAEIEGLEETLGVLDGQLSLKNATITIDV